MTDPTACPKCTHPADPAALVLYGVCDACVRQPRERTSAVIDAYANAPELRDIEDETTLPVSPPSPATTPTPPTWPYGAWCEDTHDRFPGDRTLRRWWL